MGAITSSDLIAALDAVADSMEENRDFLCALDGVIGDGDHGVAMALGFRAASDALASLGDPTPTDVLNTAAKAFLSGVGASCGPLYATGLMRAAAAVKGKVTLTETDNATLVAAMADGIAHRGKASLGDKTMLDVWRPAAEAAEQGGWPATIEAAETAAENTKNMTARLGRAARLGDRSLGHIDPGAASAVLVLKSLASQLG